MIYGFDPLEKEVIDLRKDLASSKSKRDVTKKRYDEAEAQLQELRKGEREARHDYQDCLDDNENDPSKCVETKVAWDKVKQELDVFRRGEYRTKRDEASTSEEEFDLLSKRTEEMSRRYAEAVAPMFELQKHLTELNVMVKDLYRDYARLEGATGRIMWTIRWDKLLDDYRQSNSKLPIQVGENSDEGSSINQLY